MRVDITLDNDDLSQLKDSIMFVTDILPSDEMTVKVWNSIDEYIKDGAIEAGYISIDVIDEFEEWLANNYDDVLIMLNN